MDEQALVFKNIKKNIFESRRATRNHVFNIIFQFDFFKDFLPKTLIDNYYNNLEDEQNWEIEQNPNFKIIKINKKIIEQQVFEIYNNFDKINKIICDNVIGWNIDRIDKVDISILRLAIYEMFFDEDVPNKVAINEAVELAKKYGSEKSHKFINGVLAKIPKNI